MKIVILTENTNINNGWGRYAHDLIEGIKGEGFDVLVLSEEMEGGNLAIIRRGYKIFYSVIRVIFSSQVRSASIIHALDVYPFGVIAYISNIFLRKKLIITAVGTYSVAPLHGRVGWLTKRAFKAAHVVTAISHYTKEQVKQELPNLSIQVITPGIDFKNFKINHKPSEPPYIIGVGALKLRKGYEVSLEAFARIKKIIPELRYKIIGRGSSQVRLAERIKELDIEESVDFYQNVSDDQLRDFYSHARLFVLTSLNHGYHFEGFGLVFLEAAAAGLPVVGTLNNGISDAVEDGANGLLVPQGDVDATSSAILDILKSVDVYEKMSRASYIFAEKNDVRFSIENYKKIYSELI